MISISNDEWAAHRASLKRFVGKRVSDRDDVNDIVQDVLVRAHEALHQLDDTQRLPAWLGRIAAHRIVDHFRARRPFTELPDDLAAPEPEDNPVVSLAPCLPSMIERLPDTYRDDGSALGDRRRSAARRGAKARRVIVRREVPRPARARATARTRRGLLWCRDDGLDDHRLPMPRQPVRLQCAR